MVDLFHQGLSGWPLGAKADQRIDQSPIDSCHKVTRDISDRNTMGRQGLLGNYGGPSWLKAKFVCLPLPNTGFTSLWVWLLLLCVQVEERNNNLVIGWALCRSIQLVWPLSGDRAVKEAGVGAEKDQLEQFAAFQ